MNAKSVKKTLMIKDTCSWSPCYHREAVFPSCLFNRAKMDEKNGNVCADILPPFDTSYVVCGCVVFVVILQSFAYEIYP